MGHRGALFPGVKLFVAFLKDCDSPNESRFKLEVEEMYEYTMANTYIVLTVS